MVIPSLGAGGAERVLCILANHWAASGHEVTLVTYDDGGELPFYRLDPRVVHRALRLMSGHRSVPVAGWGFVRRLSVLRKEILASKPEAVVSFMETTNVVVLLATLGTGIPVTVAERTDPYLYRPRLIWDLLRFLTYGWAKVIVTQTERAAGYFRPRHNVRLAVIPNPVPSPSQANTSDAQNEDTALRVSGPAIVTLGKLIHLKGYDILIDAFARVASRHPEWQLVIFGTGDLLQELTEQAGRLGVAKRVHFPGRTRDAHAVLKQASLYVSSSRYEGFPNALCEAMACGLPVIATDCPSGPREIVNDGVDGLLVANEDAGAMAAAMDELMGDAAQRKRLGENAANISERLSVARVAEQWETVFRGRSLVRPWVRQDAAHAPALAPGKMRLTLVVEYLGTGGTPRAMSTMANYWASQGHSIILLTYEDIGEDPFFPLDPRVDYQALKLQLKSRGIWERLKFSLKKIWLIRRTLIANKPEAVVSFGHPVNVLCLLATIGTGIPLVISERVDPSPKMVKSIWKIFRYWLYPRARCVVAQTDRMASYFKPRLEGKLEVIPNPVPVPDDEDSGEGAGVGTRTVVSFGRLDAQKGFDLLLQAFASLRTRHPDWDLKIFGAGLDRDMLVRMAADLGLDGETIFAGRVSHPYTVLKKAGIYVSSSRYEGFPNALAEAMASGLPAVATDCPTGPREMITDGIDGLLVPNEDVAALERGMDRLMSDDALRREMGGRAKLITARYGIDSVMHQWETLLHRKCGAGNAGIPQGDSLEGKA